MSVRQDFSFENDIGERGKLTGQMAVRKPLNSRKASIAGGNPLRRLLTCFTGSGRTPDPLMAKKKNVKEDDEMRKRNATITIRCTDDERRRIKEKAESHGLNVSDLVLRSALGKRIVVAKGLDETNRQIKAIGNNINQIARAVNSGQVRTVGLESVHNDLQMLCSMLGQLISEVKRCR